MNKLFLKDSFILILISINALVIFISGFDLSQSVTKILTILDIIFTLLFIYETIVKIKHYNWSIYIQSNWNKFDFILVLLSIPSILIIFFQLKLMDISFLLAFRTLRVFKVFRFFNFVPGIENLINSVKRGLKASVIILIAFATFLFVISILSNNLFKESDIFNNPATSLYTMLQLISVEGWYEIPQQIQDDMPNINVFFTRLYFVILLVVGGIFGLSFVDAVLVDAMVMDNNEELDEKVENLKLELQKDLKEIKHEIKQLNKK